jgi:hypothetical protein
MMINLNDEMINTLIDACVAHQHEVKTRLIFARARLPHLAGNVEQHEQRQQRLSEALDMLRELRALDQRINPVTR